MNDSNQPVDNSKELDLGQGGIHPTTGEYEFGIEHDALFSDLASAMKFVGTMLIVFGVLGLVGSLLRLLGPGGTVAVLDSLLMGTESFVFVLFGIWSRRAAVSFRDIAVTEGTDMTHLSIALRDLTKIYKLKYYLAILAAIGISIMILLIVLSRF